MKIANLEITIEAIHGQTPLRLSNSKTISIAVEHEENIIETPAMDLVSKFQDPDTLDLKIEHSMIIPFRKDCSQDKLKVKLYEHSFGYIRDRWVLWSSDIHLKDFISCKTMKKSFRLDGWHPNAELLVSSRVVDV